MNSPLVVAALIVATVVLAQVVRYLSSPKVGAVPRVDGEEDRGTFRVQTLRSVRASTKRSTNSFGVFAMVTSHRLILAKGNSKQARVLHVVDMLDDGEQPTGASLPNCRARRTATTNEDVSVVGLDVEADGNPHRPRLVHLSMTSPDAPRLLEALRATRYAV